MDLIDQKLVEMWHEFKTYAKHNMGYTNDQNLNECLNGAGAFIDFIRGKKPRMGTSYATAQDWP